MGSASNEHAFQRESQGILAWSCCDTAATNIWAMHNAMIATGACVANEEAGRREHRLMRH